MNNITSVAIDLAKNVFQLRGTNATGKMIFSKKMSRKEFTEYMANMPRCTVYMEACGTSNYWGRTFEREGHTVKLIHPRYVKPYVKRNKNDRNDAAGIAAAGRDPDMRFSTVKTEDQQEMQSLHRSRKLLIEHRTATANHIRGTLAEYGVLIPQGIRQIRSYLENISVGCSEELRPVIIESIRILFETFKSLDKQIEFFDKKLGALYQENEICKRLSEIPGIGKLGATILASALGNGAAFKNGRHFAAYLGLVPKQHSSGGKERLLGISKGGDTYIRTVLVHGARSVMLHASKKTDRQSMWLKKLRERRGYNKATVAWANKMARIAWALVHENTTYTSEYKPLMTEKETSAVAH